MKNSNKFLQLDNDRAHERVKNMEHLIEDAPAVISVATASKFNQLSEDHNILRANKKRTKNLLEHMNALFRTKGVVDSFYRPSFKRNLQLLRFYEKLIALAQQDKANVAYGLALLKIKAKVDTSKPDTFVEKKRIAEQKFIIPSELMAKYKQTNMDIPPEIDLAQLLFRPMIFLDFAIDDKKPLGRVFIVLYTEAAPQVVLEIMRVCRKKQLHRFKVSHLFPELWLEFEIDNFHDKQKIEFDTRALNHVEHRCVLTFPKRYVKGFPQNTLVFAITLKPLRVLNDQHVAFGTVHRGMRIFDGMKEFGNRNGNLKKPIMVTNCGVCKSRRV